MALAVIGLNHNSAPLEVREKLAFTAELMPRALTEIMAVPGVNEAAIVSTCNRTELVCDLDPTEQTAAIRWLSEFHGISETELDAYLFRHEEAESIRHVLRVAAGLDSMVLGETQILGQIKDAYRAALEHGSIGRVLNKLFQHAFFVAKKVRTDTAIGSSPVSVAFAAVRLAQQIHGQLDGKTALMIGAGDTIELAAVHLRDSGLKRIIIANRSLERAQQLASQVHGFPILLDDMNAHLEEADIVVSATASRLPILGKGAVERALKARKRRPMFMVDLAVPRDIEPEIASLDDVYLYCVDDLHSIVQDNMKSRELAARQADEIVVVQTHHFIEWLRSHDAAATIRSLRSAVAGYREEALANARRQLAAGVAPDKVRQEVTHKLCNRLLHEPTVHLREAGAAGRLEVLDTTRELFRLPD